MRQTLRYPRGDHGHECKQGWQPSSPALLPIGHPPLRKTKSILYRPEGSARIPRYCPHQEIGLPFLQWRFPSILDLNQKDSWLHLPFQPDLNRVPPLKRRAVVFCALQFVIESFDCNLSHTQEPGKRTGCGVHKQIDHGNLAIKGRLQSTMYDNHLEGVSAQVKKVILKTDLLHAQHFAPN